MSHNRNPKPPYSPQFRQQMVELVGAGLKPSDLAKEFGCHETSILSWVRRSAASVESNVSTLTHLNVKVIPQGGPRAAPMCGKSESARCDRAFA